MKFKELYEARQRGTLYHYTGYRSLLSILKNNILYTSENWGNISLTRDKSFLAGISGKDRTINAVDIKLVIDGDKLSNNYKIIPYNDMSDKREVSKKDYLNNPNFRSRQKFRESEEIIKKDIKNIKSYIKEIHIVPFDKINPTMTQYYSGGPSTMDFEGKDDFDKYINILKDLFKGEIKIIKKMR